MAKPARKSVPISSEVARSLELIRRSGTDEAKAMAELTGGDPATMSEAQALANVIDLGRRIIEERAREESYRRLAEIDAADHERAADRGARRSRRARREERRARRDEDNTA